MRALAVALASASWLIAQTTHVVQGGGAALQQAVAAAGVGDVLDVMPGNYLPVTITRSLRIVLRPGAIVQYSGLSTVVSALPAGEAVILEGGEWGGISAIGCAGAVVCSDLVFWAGMSAFPYQARIDSCTGPVVWQRFTALGGSPFITGGLIQVFNSSQVSFQNCVLPVVQIDSSSVSFADTVIPMQAATPAMRIASGSVVISGGRFTGGAVAFPIRWPGIELQLGQLVVTGGATIEATPHYTTIAMPAIRTTGGSVRVDPSVTLAGPPPIGGPAVVTTAHTPALSVARARQSATFQVTSSAEPGSLVFTLIGLPQPVVPFALGDLWLAPNNPILDVSTMPATGANVFAHSLANVPPFLLLVVQSASLSPSGTIVVGAPVRFAWD